MLNSLPGNFRGNVAAINTAKIVEIDKGTVAVEPVTVVM